MLSGVCTVIPTSQVRKLRLGEAKKLVEVSELDLEPGRSYCRAADPCAPPSRLPRVRRGLLGWTRSPPLAPRAWPVGSAFGTGPLWTPLSQAPAKAGLWGSTVLTRVDLLVAAHAIGVHDALEAGREAGGADERGGHVSAGDAVNHGAHTRLALRGPGGQKCETDGGAFGGTRAPSPAPDQDVEHGGSSLGRRRGTWGSPAPLCRKAAPPAPMPGDLGEPEMGWPTVA